MLKNEIIVVFSHVPNMACAESIAKTLVESKLAACVNISSPVTSIYAWAGQVVQSEEIGLAIKTTCKDYLALATKLQSLHPYELPEIVAIPVTDGLPAYLQWVRAETAAGETDTGESQ